MVSAQGGQEPKIEGNDSQLAEKLRSTYSSLKEELHKVIVGQDLVLDQLLYTLFSRGHCLLVGVPGLAKTLMISSLSKALDLSFSRIQFTPDLMPSDITGTEVLQEDKSSGTRVLRFLPGPIFANVILADEINRTPPKTQAALLEAMQENQVTTGGKRHPLPKPFFVLATQNPIEQEGTYPLPEAQLDRFMMMVKVEYPTIEEEREILRLSSQIEEIKIKPVLNAEDILKFQSLIRRVPIGEQVLNYAITLCRRTRRSEPDAPNFVREWVTWGAGPRASQFLVLGAKVRAILEGRSYVSAEDIAAIAHPVLRHRIITNFSAEAEGVNSDRIIDQLLESISKHENATLDDPRLPKVLKNA